MLGPRVAGDEPVLLASELPGVSVLVGPDRYRTGLHALERLPRQPDVFLLEDGFSHLRHLSTKQIRSVLETLRKKKLVKTTTSQKGNRIYKAI